MNILDPFSSDLCAEQEAWQGKGLKAATTVNVRHILCEKHSKATEALQRIQVRYTYVSHLVWLAFHIIIFTAIFRSPRYAPRPGSDLIKSLRNVRRTRPKVQYCIVTLLSLCSLT